MPTLQPSPPSHPSPLLHHHPVSVSGFGFCYKRRQSKKIGTNILVQNRAVNGRESEFEIDRDKARDALRQLDQQLDLISQKQSNPVPKIKGSSSSPYNTRDESSMKEDADPGSFLPFAVFGLLIFTVVYNIVFIQVIKPSIDGPQVELAPVRSSIMTQILDAE